ncbi:MAG TPA: vanadium-dependent haloperoxidase [Steroidobacteraceae bacterium]|nr:vanadium-dependent haloperoxidase [Steroidobacteraceae bacterium]
MNIKRSPFQITAFFSAVLIGLALLMPVRAFATGSPDSIERWNIAMTDFSAGLPLFALPPFVEMRAYAMAHIAMLNAVKSVTRPYSAGSTSVDAAVAAAAHDVLVVEFGIFVGPNTPFDSVYTAELAAIPDGTAKTRGIAVGQAAAAAMLASRASEDVLAALNAPYTPGTKPGDYQPTPPTNFVSAAGWGALSTFGVRSSAQFRAPRPYSSLKSLEYAMDVNEIAALGKAGVSARSPDQTAIAFFWFENGSFAWNRIARKISGGLSLMQHARLYAALNAAMSDAISTTLESKFYYNFWRPLTAIRAADTDGNPLTVQDPNWEPTFITPPVPDYPSGHAAAGAAAAEVLDALVGPNRPFQHTSTTASAAGPDATLTRSYDSVNDAARENAFSRMLVGIHFRRACAVGLQQGRDVARYVLEQAPFLHDD